MKTIIHKIVLLAVMFSLSVLSYAVPENNTILRFDSKNFDGTVVYAVANGDSVYALTEKDYSHLKVQTFITLKDGYTGNIGFYDFQIFPYYELTNSNGNIVPMLPIDSIDTAESKTSYCYFYPNNPTNQTATSKEEMIISISDQANTDLTLIYTASAEKINTLKISKSNYFNACQKLCEVFECWADFEVSHDENGYTTDKIVRFKNYIGKDNFSGIRYGINLKDIQRKAESKKVVTKLLVTDNNNKYANNGFCTIARAGSNETGETYIYDFSYYINQGMLSGEELYELFYNSDLGCGKDLALINEDHKGIDKPTNCFGYYVRLSKLNSEIDRIANEMVGFSTPLMQAQADVTTYEAGVNTAEEQYNSNVASFRQSAGFEYTAINVADNEEETLRRLEIVNKNATIRGYLTKIAEFLAQWQDYQKKLAIAEQQLKDYQEAYNNLEEYRSKYVEWKKELNKLFFKKYYRFIQEGTWTDGNQIDDEKYYIDALSVAYQSSLPQVSYTINVIAVDGIDGYEYFSYDLADKTFVEDEEYFGYDEYGNPYREEVVITEITYSLDEVEKDSLKVQNFKNQFQDLFQTITASVQSVNYASGAWDNAASFTEGTAAQQSAFLQNALNYADTVLTNAGEQSVVWDKTGITITDNKMPSQQMRIIAGGIFLRDEDDAGLGWKAGITPQGINAKLITSGQVNTGVVQIMRDDEPYFRWDDHGITAYYFDENKTDTITNFNSRRGVRFDRFGIYGYDMYNGFTVDEDDIVDGLTWHPDTLQEVRDNSMFSLTWDGLQLKIGQGYYLGESGYVWHESSALLGKTDGNIYNGWSDDIWTPVSNKVGDGALPEFVKVFSTGTGKNLDYEEKLAIFDNGTLLAKEARIEGTIYATAGKIGDLTIGEVESLPNDVNNAQQSANAAQATANTAQQSADNAQLTADNVNNDLNTFKEQTNVSINGLTESVNEKLKADYDGDYSWLFSNRDGLMMWSGNKGNGKAGNDENGNLNDPNLVFKVYKNEDGEGILYLHGSGVFTGGIYADYGNVGAWNLTREGVLSTRSLIDGIWYGAGLDVRNEAWTDENNDYTVFAIGENFGLNDNPYLWSQAPFRVTRDGSLYATKGQIGHMFIDDMVSRASWNLFNPDFIEFCGAIREYSKTIKNYGWHVKGPSLDDGPGVRFSNTIFKSDREYVLSFKFQEAEDSAYTITHIGGQSEAYETLRFIINGIELDYSDSGIALPVSSSEYEVEWHLRPYEDQSGVEDTSLCIIIDKGGSNNTDTIAFNIWEIKIEEGNIATKWTPAPVEDLLNIDNNFSWKFSPTEGMYMWNGSQEEEPVFKIWNNNGTHQLSLKGQVYATSGWIGEDVSTGRLVIGDGPEVTGTEKESGETVTAKLQNYYIRGFTEEQLKNIKFVSLKDKFLFGNNGILLSTSTSTTNISGTMIASGEIQLAGYNSKLTIESDYFYAYSNSGGFNKTATNSVAGVFKFGSEIRINSTQMISIGQYGSTFDPQIDIGNSSGGLELGGINKVLLFSNAGLTAYGKSVTIRSTADGSYKGYLTLSSTATLNISDYDYLQIMSSQTRLNSKDKGYLLFTSSDTSLHSYKTLLLTGNGDSDANNAAPVRIRAYSTGGKLKAQLTIGPTYGSLRGPWKRDDTDAVTSDLRLKNTIESLDSRYDKLFDNLNPYRFKYNHGTSGRYHLGFIAQELQQSLIDCDIPEKDFAALASFRDMYDESIGEQDYFAIRYEEFVPFNTWQIQKLKPRMTTAEEKIAQLENEVFTLKLELENLKNSQNSAII